MFPRSSKPYYLDAIKADRLAFQEALHTSFALAPSGSRLYCSFSKAPLFNLAIPSWSERNLPLERTKKRHHSQTSHGHHHRQASLLPPHRSQPVAGLSGAAICLFPSLGCRRLLRAPRPICGQCLQTGHDSTAAKGLDRAIDIRSDPSRRSAHPALAGNLPCQPASGGGNGIPAGPAD